MRPSGLRLGSAFRALSGRTGGHLRPVAVPGASRRASSGKAGGPSSSNLAGGPSSANAAHEPHSQCATKALLPAYIVQSRYTKAALPVIGHSAYITLVSGFLMTDVLALRTLLICGYTGLVAFHLLHERPLRIPLRWSAFFVFVNGVMALMLARDRFPGAFDEEQVRHAPRAHHPLTA